jgi:ubiquinone/menaquinone biosynthesis C-methylase UbiE
LPACERSKSDQAGGFSEILLNCEVRATLQGCSMTDTSAAYPMGGSQLEKQRLLSQAGAFRTQATQLLGRIGILPGWRAVDVGCGPIGILDLLSERVGPRRLVMGLEREPLFCEMAREEISKRGLKNVKIVQGDALSTGLEKQSFNLVHERLVLLNVQDREAFLAEMVSLLRPGGVIVLEDIDSVSWVCHPAHHSWDALRNAPRPRSRCL